MRKEKRYGGAERAWDVRAGLPILWRWTEGLVYVKCRVRKGKGEGGGRGRGGEGGGVVSYTLLLLWGERRGES